jgi:hypothetical protein
MNRVKLFFEGTGLIEQGQDVKSKSIGVTTIFNLAFTQVFLNFSSFL